MTTNTRDWISFWNAPHSIYVNARHLDAHYRLIAEAIAGLLAKPDGDADNLPVVLDYGCGEALHAAMIARRCARLILCDAAPRVRAALAERFAAETRIDVRAPEEVEALPPASLDCIVMVSVVQYLDGGTLDRLLAAFRRLLKPTGRLILGDVVPPSVSPVTDAAALLGFAWRNGFFGAALLGLIRTAFSDYRRLRSTIGLSLYDPAAIGSRLEAAGFAAERAPRNIGHNAARMTFLARPRRDEASINRPASQRVPPAAS